MPSASASPGGALGTGSANSKLSNNLIRSRFSTAWIASRVPSIPWRPRWSVWPQGKASFKADSRRSSPTRQVANSPLQNGMKNLILLGDSILDNGAYTNPGPDTATHLRTLLGPGWAVLLQAQDGATLVDARSQSRELAIDVDCAVLSVGGNDALGNIGLLSQRATSAAEVLAALDALARPFAEEYLALLSELRQKVKHLAVCTIYEAPLSDPVTARLATVPLSLLNDRIIRAAARVGADVIDLRTVCTLASDFVLDIEPSAAGALKIAQAIHRAVRPSDGAGSVRLFAT